MKTFIFKCFLFVIPLGFVFVIPLFVVWLGREYFDANTTALYQQAHPGSVVGFAYSTESARPYKVALINARHSTVIALGTSRVMQFRKEFFKDQNTFTNAGGAVTSFSDIISFINEMPEVRPGETKTVLLGIDQEAFLKPLSDVGTRKGDSVDTRDLLRIGYIIVSGSRRMYTDQFTKFSLWQLYKARMTTSSIGVAALIQDDGYRDDGSRIYKSMSDPNIMEIAQRQIEARAKEIEIDQFVPNNADDLISGNIQLLSHALDIAHAKGITIIGFMQPLPTKEYDATLVSSISNQKTVTEIPSTAKKVFTEHGYVFDDFTRLDSFGGKDVEFIDRIHGSDLMYAKLTLLLTKEDPSFGKLVNIDLLKTAIKASTGIFLALTPLQK